MIELDADDMVMLTNSRSNWLVPCPDHELGDYLPLEKAMFQAERKTRQDQAFEKMMRIGKCPPTDSVLIERRFDSEEDMQRFCNQHQFIHQITDYGFGTYVVEVFA